VIDADHPYLLDDERPWSKPKHFQAPFVFVRPPGTEINMEFGQALEGWDDDDITALREHIGGAKRFTGKLGRFRGRERIMRLGDGTTVIVSSADDAGDLIVPGASGSEEQFSFDLRALGFEFAPADGSIYYIDYRDLPEPLEPGATVYLCPYHEEDGPEPYVDIRVPQLLESLRRLGGGHNQELIDSLAYQQDSGRNLLPATCSGTSDISQLHRVSAPGQDDILVIEAGGTLEVSEADLGTFYVEVQDLALPSINWEREVGGQLRFV
jgi:hypothetical protein